MEISVKLSAHQLGFCRYFWQDVGCSTQRKLYLRRWPRSPTLHQLHYWYFTSPYLARECETLILGDLLQQLLALALFFLFFALINFSLQLLKLQILQTFSLLLLFLAKQKDEMTEKSMTGKYSVRFSAVSDASEHWRCKQLTDQFTTRFQVVEVFLQIGVRCTCIGFCKCMVNSFHLHMWTIWAPS